jgi:hypothetical protein
MKRLQKKCTVFAAAAVLTLALTVPAAMAMPEEIVGAVIDSGAGYDVIAASGEYLVPNADLSKVVGETVAVTGNVEVGADSLAIDPVRSVQVLSKRDLIDAAGGMPTAGR